MDFGIFSKKTSRRIQGIKNHSIWINIRGEMKEQKIERKIICEEREN